LKKIIFLTLLFSGSLFAQIINTAPYILTVDELKSWTNTGATASTDLIAIIPLAERFTNSATQFNPALSNDMKIAYLPDGMNNFGNYYGEQDQFNLYNFTHWAYIDKFVWFGGTSSQTIQIPSSPWANVAHKNGVKIFGNVFFAPTAFGGSKTTLQSFLEKDDLGNFIAVDKMIAIMEYYKFDGWFINEETATNAATALLMHEFVATLTARAEALGKEVMWYDAMTLSGSVGWQNRLNATNSPFLQNDLDGDTANGFEQRVSSSIFINFFWNGSALPNVSKNRAAAIGRSAYDVFTGADIWPGRNQGNFAASGNTFMTALHDNAGLPVTSLGFFAPNCVYNSSVFSNFNNDPNDYEAFYSAENHLFGGLDRNPGTVDATGFKGVANWVPETSVLSSYFSTNFNTGHGTKKFTSGSQTSTESWHDMNQQDILPTWQWAFSQNGILSAKYDFDDAFSGGNSLKVTGNLPANTPIDLMLYQTKIQLSHAETTEVNLIYKSAEVNDSKIKLLLVFADEPAQKYEFSVDEGLPINNWNSKELLLSEHQGREIIAIGLRFASETAVANFTANIGGLSIDQHFLNTINQNKKNNFVTVSYPQGNNIAFTINWPVVSKVDYTVSNTQGKIIKREAVSLNKTTNHLLNTSGWAAGTYLVTFSDKNNVSETKKIIVK